MNLRPFFCFYGGKWRAAPRYPAPQYDTIIEPFAGAAGYSTRYPDRKVVLIEKDPVIADLWRYLISVSSEEVRRIPLLGPCQTVDDLHVCAEAKSLVGFWINKGTASPCRSPSAWMRSGVNNTSFWSDAVRSRIAEQVEHIRHWRIVNTSYEHAECHYVATWFVDPPYEQQGRHYRCSAHEIDFNHLGAWCQRLRGQVLVCEQKGAAWLPFSAFATVKSNPSRHGKGKCDEVLWTNVEVAAALEAK